MSVLALRKHGSCFLTFSCLSLFDFRLNLDGTVAWSYANDVTGVDLGGGVNIIKSGLK